MRTIIIPSISLLFCVAALSAEPPYTPKPGSKTRAEICDAVRRDQRTPEHKYVIEFLRVQDDWAIFDASPTRNTPGTDEPIPVAAVLRRRHGKWTVVGSWLHGDVPSGSEFKRLAKDLPDSLVKEYDSAHHLN